MFLVCAGCCREFLHLILGGNQETVRKLYDKSGRGIYFRSFASKNASSALCLGESPPDHLSSNFRTSAWG